jgi:hypothetical protein
MSNKIRLSALCLALGALGLPTAFGYDFILNDSSPRATNLPIRWQQPTFPMRILLGADRVLIDGTNFSTSFLAAMEAWNPHLGTIQFQGTIATGTPGENNRTNEVAFAPRVFDREFGENVVAVATTWHIGNERTQCDIIFNSTRNWDSYRGATRRQGNDNLLDLRRVALHELGHALGLDHPDEAGQTITPTPIMNSRAGNTDSLTNDDIAGAQQLYGPKGIPANDNFANAITLSGSNVTTTGHNTNATREPGEPNHAGGNGSRSVWWRWTSPAPGQVTINTRGSYYDTTLGIYTGTAVNQLTTIASSDDIESGIVQASELSFTTTAGTTYHIAVDGWSGDQAGLTLNIRLAATGPELPLITTQPVSTTVTVGGTVSFSVTATSSAGAITYQWHRLNAPISGATSATYTISNAQLADAGAYTVVVTNSSGSITSDAAVLTVNTPTPPPPPPPSGGGNSGGGGGGGSPSLWFIAAISALGLARRFLRSHA